MSKFREGKSVKRTVPTTVFFCHFIKENNFCLFLMLLWVIKLSKRESQFLNERICSYKSKFFLLRIDPHIKILSRIYPHIKILSFTRRPPFERALSSRKSKQEVTGVVSLLKMVDKHGSVPILLKVQVFDLAYILKISCMHVSVDIYVCVCLFTFYTFLNKK